MKNKVGPIEFDESKRFISEVLGWSDDLYEEMIKVMSTHFVKDIVASNGKYTKTQLLSNFIKSNPELFEELKTNNDLFMLGFVFVRCLSLVQGFVEEKMEEKTEKSLKDLIDKKLKDLGLETEGQVEKISASSAEDAADKVVQSIIKQKVEARQKKEKAKIVN